MAFAYNEIVVDLATIKKFTDRHLEIHEILVNPDHLPQWFKSECEGGLLPDAIKFDGFYLHDEKDISTYAVTEQGARKSGANPNEPNIYIDMKQYGYKLGEISPFVYEFPQTKKRIWVNGKSRNKLLIQFGMKNRIVGKFLKRDNSYTDDEVANALSLLGTYWNSLNSPAGDVLEEDIIDECEYAIDKEWICKGNNLMGERNINFDEIYDRLVKSSGKGKFTKEKLETYAWRIFHHSTGSGQGVHSWKKPIDGVNKLVALKHIAVTTPTRFIRYKLVSYSTISKSLIDMSHDVMTGDYIARDDAELRIIFHSGELTGFKLVECYENRIKNAFTQSRDALRVIGGAFFDGEAYDAKKIKFYGALPAIEEADGKPYHDMNKLVKFREDSSVKDGGHLYQ